MHDASTDLPIGIWWGEISKIGYLNLSQFYPDYQLSKPHSAEYK
jgi:hypothetical protein